MNIHILRPIKVLPIAMCLFFAFSCGYKENMKGRIQTLASGDQISIYSLNIVFHSNSSDSFRLAYKSKLNANQEDKMTEEVKFSFGLIKQICKLWGIERAEIFVTPNLTEKVRVYELYKNDNKLICNYNNRKMFEVDL